MTAYDSLLLALEGKFETKLNDLPEALRERVEREMYPCPWDHLSPEQRRSLAWQIDFQNDPAAEEDREFWFNFYNCKDELRNQISEWESIPAQTAGELVEKEQRLKELQSKLVSMERREEDPRVSYYPQQEPEHSPDPESIELLDSKDQYIACPKALMQLAERLRASPEELAAWVCVGPEHGRLAAYLKVNELDPPPEFHFGPHPGDDFDYLSPLMACWFREDDVLNFSPTERYITGAALIDRWSKHDMTAPVGFIRAKIAESRLWDLHPIAGQTQGRMPGNDAYPPIESGLFARSEIEAIEETDFDAGAADRRAKNQGRLNHDAAFQTRANEIAKDLMGKLNRNVTKNEVAKRLAEQCGLNEATVLRRIRKRWKSL